MLHFSSDTNAFLQRLANHNDRDWFEANRADYERAIKEPAELFAMTMSAALEAETGRYHNPKIFRIFRDVRFSKDKRPYNTHVRISFTSGQGAAAPGYFFSLERDHLMLGAGVFGYEKTDLENFRNLIHGEEGAELQKITASLSGMGMRMSDPELRRVPAPYSADHPRAELLCRKGLTVWIDDLDCRIAYGHDAIERCLAEFRKMMPLHDWMSNLSRET